MRFSNGAVFIHIVAQRAVRTRYARNACFFHRRDCGYFVAHQANGFCFRADEDKAGAFNLLGKNWRSRRGSRNPDGLLLRR